MPGHDLIVVGASAGGVEALTTLVRSLPPDLPAALCVVLHMSAESPSLLPAILDRSGPLSAVTASDGAAIRHGYIYVAVPDQHLLIEHNHLRLVHGPRINRARPAIDPLFQSAARAYGPRVIGVILSGMLDDGTRGLQEIKQFGGIAVVQEPAEAMYASMPQSALTHVAVDYCHPVAEIGTLVAHLAHASLDETAAAPTEPNEAHAHKPQEKAIEFLNIGEPDGKPSVFSCPECGGVLWEIQDGNLLSYRCRVGHAFTTDSMQAEQAEALEQALWVALKTLEESAALSQRLAEQARQRNQNYLAHRFQFQEKEQATRQKATVIRQTLLSMTSEVINEHVTLKSDA